MERIELVGPRLARNHRLLQPIPLRNRGFDQRRGRIRVVLEHLRRPIPVPGKIESPVQGRLIVVPGLLDVRDERVGNRKSFVGALVDDVARSFDAHFMQGVGGFFQRIDFLRREAVTDALVPIHPVNRVKPEAQLLHALRPVGTWNAVDAFHPVRSSNLYM